MLAEDRQRHGREKRQLADGAVAPPEAPRPPRAAADREALHAHRKPVLEDLRVGHARVGHVTVHGARAVEAGAGAAAAADRLVVAEPPVAEQDVVHRPLAAGREAERLEERVHEPLAGLDVAPDDGRGERRLHVEVGVQESARDREVHGAHQPLVQRQWCRQEKSEDVHDDAAHDGGGGVEVSGMLGGRSGEVDGGAVSRERDHHAQGRAVVEPLDRLVASRRDPAQRLADALGGELLQSLHLARDRRGAMITRQGAQRLGPGVVGGHRGAQVGEVVLDCPGRVGRLSEQATDGVPERLLVADQVHRGDHHALLHEAGRRGRHRAGAAAADLGVVRAAGDVPEENGRALFGEDGCDDRDVGQMRSAAGRMVGDRHIARPQRQHVAQAADAQTHRAQVHGDVRGVDDQLSGSVQDGAGEVEALLDIRRDGGAAQPLAHVGRDRAEPVGEQLEPDGFRARRLGG